MSKFFSSGYITHKKTFSHHIDQSCLLLQLLVKLTLQCDLLSFTIFTFLRISANTFLCFLNGPSKMMAKAFLIFFKIGQYVMLKVTLLSICKTFSLCKRVSRTISLSLTIPYGLTSNFILSQSSIIPSYYMDFKSKGIFCWICIWFCFHGPFIYRSD